MKYLFLMIAMLVPALAADTKEDKVTPVKPPVLSEKGRTNFWKTTAIVAQAETAKAQTEAARTTALANQQAAINDLIKECGELWNLAQDPQTLEPICVEKPKPTTPDKPADKK